MIEKPETIYLSPCILTRIDGRGDGVQWALSAAESGAFQLDRLNFRLHPGSNFTDEDSETTTSIATGLDAGQAVITLFAEMNRVLDQGLHDHPGRIQVWRGRTPTALKDNEAALALPTMTRDYPSVQAVFDRLSSRWGQKTAPLRENPDARRPRHDFFFN